MLTLHPCSLRLLVFPASSHASAVLVANRTCPSANMTTVQGQSITGSKKLVQMKSKNTHTHAHRCFQLLSFSAMWLCRGPLVWTTQAHWSGHLAVCLLLSSILVAVILIRGIKSSGKVSGFSATHSVEHAVTHLEICPLECSSVCEGVCVFLFSRLCISQLRFRMW